MEATISSIGFSLPTIILRSFGSESEQLQPGQCGKFLSMVKAQVVAGVVHAFRRFISARFGVNRFAAYPAPNEFQGSHRIPVPLQQMAELDGLLGTNPPALTAPRTSGHVVQNFTGISVIFVGKGACRTVFNTRQAAVASAIYSKVRHRSFNGAGRP
jgi:hypothetical protein